MRTFIALMLTLAMTAPALAQRQRGGGGGMGGFGGPMAILRSEDVQKDIKLSDEQKTKVKEFQDKQAAARREAFGGPGGGGGFDREKMQEFAKKSAEETAKFLKDTLTEEQTKRLKEISLQQSLKTNPAGAFFTISFSRDGLTIGDPTETGKALKMTDEQKDKIKTINEQMGKDMRELRPEGGGRPSADAQKKMEALRKEAADKIMEVLTDEQKKTLDGLKGKPFEGKIDTGFGGGRRPGAGGAPGGAGAGGGNRRPGGGGAGGNRRPGGGGGF